nr:methylated-DNA--[protein]-cysteine S-methyltransferase [Candidatus Symbiobacter mobilis]
MSPVLDQAVEELAEYFAGKRTRFDVPLGHRLGSSFCHAVWEQTRAIPYGTTIAYGALGKYIAKDGKACAPRAVAAALRANPLLLFQPCHRVVYASGALSGYAAGTDRKAALLRLESGLGI